MAEDNSSDLEYYSFIAKISKDVLEKYLSGEEIPDSYNLCKLVEVFETTVDYFIGRTDIAHPTQTQSQNFSKNGFSEIFQNELYNTY